MTGKANELIEEVTQDEFIEEVTDDELPDEDIDETNAEGIDEGIDESIDEATQEVTDGDGELGIFCLLFLIDLVILWLLSLLRTISKID